MEEQNGEKINKLIIPLAIVVAGVIIAGAIYLSPDKSAAPKNDPSPTNVDNTDVNQQLPQGDTASLDKMTEISNSDHVLGDRNALVKIVEYSDTECPFCKRFHETMNQIMDEYGKDGKVAWVYRHFPLDQLHPKARSEAVAFECANELGGNDKFWSYADRLFAVTPANNGLDAAELPKIAQYVGLDVNKFNTCLSSGKYDKHIEDEVQNAQATGGNGTPWSIVVAKNGKKFPLNGAQPYEAIKQLIELALQEK
ncbi:MAG: thioredoxin domain-containing protein [Patescibacteria group bacterium]